MKKIIFLSLIAVVFTLSCKNDKRSENNSNEITTEVKNPASEIAGNWETDKKWNSGTPLGRVSFKLRGDDVIMEKIWVNGMGKKSESTKVGKFSNGILDLGDGIYGGKIVFSEDLKSFKERKYTYRKVN